MLSPDRMNELAASDCTSKANCLHDRLNIQRSPVVLLMCEKHLADYTTNYTPNGFCTKGKRKAALCSLCPDSRRLVFRQLHQSSIGIFKENFGSNTVIGTPVCRVCYNGCVEKYRVKEQENECQPLHSQPATVSVTDDDGLTTVYSQEEIRSQSQLIEVIIYKRLILILLVFMCFFAEQPIGNN